MTTTIESWEYDLNKKFQQDEEYETKMEELYQECSDFLEAMADKYDLTCIEIIERMNEL